MDEGSHSSAMTSDENVHQQHNEWDHQTADIQEAPAGAHEPHTMTTKRYGRSSIDRFLPDKPKNRQMQAHETMTMDDGESPRNSKLDGMVVKRGSDDMHHDDPACILGPRPETVESVEFEHDIYSLLFVSKINTQAFWVSFAVLTVQVSILVLLILDLLKTEDKFAQENKFKAPLIGNDTTVIMAQYTAIIISILAQDDILKTIGLVTVSFNAEDLYQQMCNCEGSTRDTMKTIDKANYFKFILCVVTRFISGLLTIFISFIFIVQSDNILDMFMNFAAVEFVGQLDNMVFEIALHGLFGDNLAQSANLVTHLSLPVTRPHLAWIQRSIFSLMVIGMISSMAVLQTRQTNGVFLYDSSCLDMYITLGDATLGLDHPFYLGDTKRNTSFFALEILNASVFDKDVDVVVESPPDLVYSFFSGRYEAFDDQKPFNRRPVYYQDGMTKDGTAGMFYYCDEEEAWVFTIPALGDNIPKASLGKCKYGWLIQSPITEAASLEDAPLEGWHVWTGTIETMDIQISCNQCVRDADCGLENGVCNAKTRSCDCNRDWDGSKCDHDRTLCPRMTWVKYGSTSEDFQFDESVFPLEDPTNANATLFMYDRPTYYTITNFSAVLEVDLIFYAGSRWLQAFWDYEKFLSLYATEPYPIHAFWHVERGDNVAAFSESTTSFYPSNNKWFNVRASGSLGATSSALVEQFGAHYEDESVRLDCTLPVYKPRSQSEVETNKHFTTCGRFGRPNVSSATCHCESGYGGFSCEFEPDGPYVQGQASAFMDAFDPSSGELNEEAYTKNTFHYLFWDEYSDAQLYDAMCIYTDCDADAADEL